MTGRGGLRSGSGRPGKHIQIEQCRHIDVRLFQRAGMLKGPWIGQWSWRDPKTSALTSQIEVIVAPPCIQLTYRWRDQLHTDKADLVKSACSFGGSRTWFSCPGCQRRTTKLHLFAGRFRCRSCHDLRYRSQSLSPLDRLHRSKQKLEDLLAPSWQRPIGMHRATRTRIIAKIIEIEASIDDQLFQALQNQ